MNKTCMSCKHYKVEDVQSGRCRLSADSDRGYSMVSHDHGCSSWADCGQNYYIRLGWAKAQENKKK